MPVLAERIFETLEVLPLESLKLHEQTIESNVVSLTEAMLNLGRLVDPLIVEKKHKVVLDGNHRRQVLENLKAPLAVCQAVDYESDNIRIGGWFPAIKKVPESLGKLKSETVDFDEGMAALEKKKAYFMLVSDKGKKNCRLFPAEEETLHGIISKQVGLLREVNGKENGEFNYYEDTMSDEALSQGMSVFYRKNYSKEEIIAEAVAGRPLPPKSTRHMIPDRIIRLNLPLGWLYEDRDEAISLLDGMIKKRAVNHNVRRYTEPVIVIY